MAARKPSAARFLAEMFEFEFCAVKVTPERLADPATRRIILQSIVTRYDQAEEARELKRKHGRVNIYRLGLLLATVERVEADIAAGASIHRALYDNARDTLLTRLERACGLPVTYGGGAHDTGRPA